MIDVESMTQAEREALPWYGGNKIPDSYLKKFRTSDNATHDLPYELRLFLGEFGEKKSSSTR